MLMMSSLHRGSLIRCVVKIRPHRSFVTPRVLWILISGAKHRDWSRIFMQAFLCDKDREEVQTTYENLITWWNDSLTMFVICMTGGPRRFLTNNLIIVMLKSRSSHMFFTLNSRAKSICKWNLPYERHVKNFIFPYRIFACFYVSSWRLRVRNLDSSVRFIALTAICNWFYLKIGPPTECLSKKLMAYHFQQKWKNKFYFIFIFYGERLNLNALRLQEWKYIFSTPPTSLGTRK